MRQYLLVAEDDPEIRENLSDALRAEGYDITACRDGQEALDHLRASDTPPFLIFLDLMMPTVPGWDVLTAMSEDPKLAEIPVCVLSAFAHMVRPARATYVLPKPVRLAALLDIIQQHQPPAR